MAKKINVAKNGKSKGKRFMNITTDEYTGALHSAVQEVFKLRELVRAAELEAIKLHDEEFPELSMFPIRFRWEGTSVALDDNREPGDGATTATVTKVKQSLADFINQQLASGRNV